MCFTSEARCQQCCSVLGVLPGREDAPKTNRTGYFPSVAVLDLEHPESSLKVTVKFFRVFFKTFPAETFHNNNGQSR
jgi:hypothetical protein